MSKKYIHYCWFGDNKISKLGKKCIESWKKFLPDYEIIKWDESNSDLEECEFVKGAYKAKKWAFVADYVRTKAINEYGGIYFDTDMEVTKDISDLLNKESFLGVEDSGAIACGVWYEKNPKEFLSSKLLEKYRSIKEFDVKNMSKYSIPNLITEILLKHGFKFYKKNIQILDLDGSKLYIYPRDYFYPYSYNWNNNDFSKNTRMIHYYDASWVPLREKIDIYLVRHFGSKKALKIMKLKWKMAGIAKKIIKIPLYPLVLIRRKIKKTKEQKGFITDKYLKELNETINGIKENKNKDYIVFHNKNFMGVTSSTLELFKNTIHCGEIYRDKDAAEIVDTINQNNIKQIIFSSLSQGQMKIIELLKKSCPNIKIKAYWHGSHSQILDTYGFERLSEIIKALRERQIDALATCKKSLYNFYKSQGLNVFFLTNKVIVDEKIKEDVQKTKKEADNEKNNNIIKIGLYAASSTDWRKNIFTQLAAIKKIPNAIVDLVPSSENAEEFCKLIGLKYAGLNKGLPREQIIKRMAGNDINLYITYSECSPMLPLESLEVNVPCIAGNNHHYFENKHLEEYLIVNNESNSDEIAEKMLKVLNEKEKVLELYKEFRKMNIENCDKLLKKFLED